MNRERRVIIVGCDLGLGESRTVIVDGIINAKNELLVVNIDYDKQKRKSLPPDFIIVDDIDSDDQQLSEDKIQNYLNMVEKAMMDGELYCPVSDPEPLVLKDMALRDPIEFIIDHKIYVPKSRRERRMNQRPYKYHK